MAGPQPPRPGLDWSKALVPMAKGLGQDVDPRVRPMGTLTTATNCHFDKAGALVKRNGFTAQATSVKDFVVGGADADYSLGDRGSIRTLVSTGDELLAVTQRDTLALTKYGPVNLWAYRGHGQPFTGERATVMTGQRSFFHLDSACVNIVDASGVARGTICTVGISIGTSGSGAGNNTYSLVYRVDTQEGANIIPPTTIVAATATATSIPYACKVIAVSGGALPNFVIAYSRNYSAGGLYLTSVPATAPDNINIPPTTYLGALGVYIEQYGMRSFDICDKPNEDDVFYVAWCDATNNRISIHQYDVDGTSNYSATIGGPASGETWTTGAPDYGKLALHWDATNSLLVLAAHSDAAIGGATGSDEIEVWAIGYTLAALNFGPVTYMTGVQTDECQTIGVTSGLNDDAEQRYVVTIAGEQNTGTTSKTVPIDDAFLTQYVSSNSSGADLDSVQKIENFAILAQPFFVAGKCYLTGATSCGALSGFDSIVVCELRTERTSQLMVKPVGICAPGLAGRVGGATGGGGTGFDNVPLRLGSANTVTVDQNGKYVFAGHILIANMVAPTPANPYSFSAHLAGATDPSERYAGIIVKLDPAGTFGAVSAMRGTAVIAGGCVNWTDGTDVFELGYVHPPVANVTLASDGGTAGALPAYDYTWYSYWEYYDTAGVLHRSAPVVGNGMPYTMPGGGTYDELDLEYRTLGVTGKGERPTVAVYRDGPTDGIPRRVINPMRTVHNSATTELTDTYIDNGAYRTGREPPMYTVSGELEPSITEGARIVALVNERLWLAGFWARDRVAYSKKLTPGTFNEELVAPEFHELLAFQLPDGLACTGLGAIDEKVAVFSEESVWIIAGDGPDAGGAGSDFSGLVTVSNDAGCIEHRSVVAYPGGVMFQSKAGIYQVTRAHQVEFVGEPVRDELAAYPTVTSAVLVPKATQLRFTCMNAAGTDSIVLVFDYRMQAWTKWKPLGASGANMAIVSAAVHNDEYYIAEAAAVWKEDSTTYYDAADVFVPMAVRTSWIQAAQPAGWQRVRRIVPVLDQQDPSDITVSVYHDYSNVVTDAIVFPAATVSAWENPSAIANPLVRTTRQKCHAVSVEVSDAEAATTSTGAGYTIAGVQLEIGIKRGLARTEGAKAG